MGDPLKEIIFPPIKGDENPFSGPKRQPTPAPIRKAPPKVRPGKRR